MIIGLGAGCIVRSPIALLLWAFIFFALFPILAFSLETDLEKPASSQDDLDDLLAEGIIGEDEYNRLSHLLAHPLDLNSASLDELESLPSIDRAEASEIIELRDKSPFGNVDDLNSLLERREFDLVKPFVKVSSLESPVSGSNRFKASLKGPPDSSEDYDYSLYDRISLTYEDVFVVGYLSEYGPGFDLDKLTFSEKEKALILQPKEPIWENGHRWYLGLKDLKLSPGLALRRAVVGDYGLKFGQGLTLNEGGVRKGGIRFNTSLSEYFFGGASQAEWEVLSLTAFYSNDDYGAAGETVVEGDKKTLTIPRIYHEDVYGANANVGLDFLGSRFQLGSTYFHGSLRPRVEGYTIIGYPLGPDGRNLNEFDLVGIDFSIDRREGRIDYTLGGEFAWLIEGGIAFLLKGQVDEEDWGMKSTFLHLGSDYLNPHSNPSVGPVRSGSLTPENKELRVSSRRGYTYGSVEAGYVVLGGLDLDGRYSLWRFVPDETLDLERGLTQSELKMILSYQPLDSVEIKASNKLNDRDMARESRIADSDFEPLDGELKLALTLTPQDGADLTFTYAEGYSTFSLTIPQTDDGAHTTFRSYSPQLRLDLPYEFGFKFKYTLRESFDGVSAGEDLAQTDAGSYRLSDRTELKLGWKPSQLFQADLAYKFSANDIYEDYDPEGAYSLGITTKF